MSVTLRLTSAKAHEVELLAPPLVHGIVVAPAARLPLAARIEDAEEQLHGDIEGLWVRRVEALGSAGKRILLHAGEAFETVHHLRTGI